MAQKSLKNSELKIKDAGANSVTVKIGDGNYTWSEKRTVEYTLNRGLLSSANGGAARLGDDVPMDVSFDILFEYYKSTGAENPTPIEALKKEGAASAWETTQTDDECAPYAVDLELTYDPECTPSELTNPVEVFTFSHFRWESIDGDLSAGRLSVKGTCQTLSPSVVRTT